MAYSLGIDLGTTFTAAAVARDGRATSVPLGTDRDAMPTAVYVMEDGATLVGEPAIRRGLADPTRLAREFKRRVGDPTPILVGGVPWSAEALSAEILRSVVDTVTAAEGAPPDSVTVTHPANWGAFKRDVLEQAVRLAGSPGAHLLSEPEAAAIAYASRERVEVGEYIAVYDLGGGTFDVTIVRRDGDGFEIIGEPDGIERLGGIDFDEAVFAHVTAALGGELASLDAADPAVISAMAELRANCIRAKEALSADTEATIPVPLPDGLRRVRLTRAEFEDMIRSPLGRTIEVVERTIANAGIPTSYLSRVLLVGGSSRIPLVGQLVASTLARPVTVDAHPKHVVASGAALRGLASLPAYGAPPPSPALTSGMPLPPYSPGHDASATGTAGLDRPNRRGVTAVVVAVIVAAVVGGIVLVTRDSGTSASSSSQSSTSSESSTSSTSTPTSQTVSFPFGGGACPNRDGTSPRTIDFADAPRQCIDAATTYTATFDTTAGQVVVRLDTSNTPGTANNFVVLSRYHYYDNTLLFRVAKSIGIIQGGSPHDNSAADPGPGYNLPDEGFTFDDLTTSNGSPSGGPYRYAPGDLVMARTAQPNGAGAQFFFGVNENVSLLDEQGIYVKFGEVTEGLDVLVQALESAPADEEPPNPPVTIRSVTIAES